MPNETRGSIINHNVVSIDGAQVSWIFKVSGGEGTYEMITDKVGGLAVAQTYAGSVIKVSEVEISAGMGACRTWLKNINLMLNGGQKKVTGSYAYAGPDLKERHRCEFLAALISEIGFPALDASNNEATKLTIKLQPTTATHVATPDGGADISAVNDAAEVTRWRASKFRFDATMFPSAMPFVQKVDAITVKQKANQVFTGSMLGADVVAGQPEIGELKVTYVMTTAVVPIYNAFLASVNTGTPVPPTAATLDYLGADGSTVLLSLAMENMVMKSCKALVGESGSDTVSGLEVTWQPHNIVVLGS